MFLFHGLFIGGTLFDEQVVGHTDPLSDYYSALQPLNIWVLADSSSMNQGVPCPDTVKCHFCESCAKFTTIIMIEESS